MASTAESKDNSHLNRDKVIASLNSTDALALIEHGSELTLDMNPPVGERFVCRTKMIGVHSDKYIVAEVPDISGQQLNYYFQVGFWCNIQAISHRGEGGIVVFRSQLLHLIPAPTPMVLFSIPRTMQVTQLRKEPRFEVNLAGKAISETHKVDCEIRDISKSGCRFITSPLARSYQIDEKVSVQLHFPQYEQLSFGILEGRICNIQRSTHYSRYGLEFSEDGRINAGELLSKLKFTGTKMTLNMPKKKR